MGLGIELERKRDAAQMSAAAVSFVLDREGHKKFLRTATNQELEMENTKLQLEVNELSDSWLRYSRTGSGMKSEGERSGT